jgi:hypothetical protein
LRPDYSIEGQGRGRRGSLQWAQWR